MKRIAIVLVSVILCAEVLSAQLTDDDRLPAEFHADRREQLRELMPDNSVAVFFANPVRNRANDVDYVYHQDPDFYYLTGYLEPHSVLLVFSDKQRDDSGVAYDELLFAQARNPHQEMWTGRRLGPEGAAEQLELEKVVDHRDFSAYPIDFARFSKVFFFNFHNDVRDEAWNDADLYDLIESYKEKAGVPADFNPILSEMYVIMKDGDKGLKERKQDVYRLSRRNPRLLDDRNVKAFMEAQDIETAMNVISRLPKSNLDVTSLDRMMATLRQEKTEEEIALLTRAVRISCIGQIEVMKAMHPQMSETEIQGIHEFVFKKYGAEYEGYPSIVGAGANGCILHYIENNKRRVEDDLVLMDLGAEYRGYTADVTRTIPADGTFSKEQAAIYQVVYDAQEAGFAECKPGNQFYAPHSAAQKVIDEGLERLGIITKGQRHQYFPHGTSHYLGLDVHDRGLNGPLMPGQVITVEPGIYIPPDSPCDEKWWGIAVRIEDDILITKDGWVNLSASAPRTIQEIEATMAQPSALDDFRLPALEE